MEYMESKMQEHMESGQNELDELIDEFNPPGDWSSPKWEKDDKVHSWRNYANAGIIRDWHDFNWRQKIMISAMLNDIAGQEEWD